jgi:hypothetical protein
MTQRFDRWLAVPDVVEPFGGISVVSRGDGTTTLLLHAKDRDLKITFNIIIGPAQLLGNAVARSTQTFGCSF